jgi:hypothetical protein
MIGYGQKAVPTWEYKLNTNAVPFLAHESSAGNFLMYTKDNDPNFEFKNRFYLFDKLGKLKGYSQMTHLPFSFLMWYGQKLSMYL